MALPGAYFQDHLVLLAVLVSCRVVVIGRGGWGRGLSLLSVRLLEAHEQLEGWLGHWVRHVVGDVNLWRMGGRGLGALWVEERQGRAWWGTARRTMTATSGRVQGTSVIPFSLETAKWAWSWSSSHFTYLKTRSKHCVVWASILEMGRLRVSRETCPLTTSQSL